MENIMKKIKPLKVQQIEIEKMKQHFIEKITDETMLHNGIPNQNISKREYTQIFKNSEELYLTAAYIFYYALKQKNDDNLRFKEG